MRFQLGNVLVDGPLPTKNKENQTHEWHEEME